jgi:hypothetical protein
MKNSENKDSVVSILFSNQNSESISEKPNLKDDQDHNLVDYRDMKNVSQIDRDQDKGDQSKEGQKSPFQEYCDKIAEEIGENENGKKVVCIKIGIKINDLKNTANNKDEKPAKISATKLTIYSDGSEESEDIEIEISSEEASAMIERVNQSKSASTSINDAIEQVVGALTNNGSKAEEAGSDQIPSSGLENQETKQNQKPENQQPKNQESGNSR